MSGPLSVRRGSIPAAPRRAPPRLRAALLTAGLLAATAALAACNTVAGAGQDVSNAGNAVTNSAEKNK
jgi:predicted small secreted protein